MIFRIFIGIVVVVAAFMVYDIYRLNQTYNVILNIEQPYALSSADADLTVVEFLSYSCPYCRDAHPIIMEAVQNDGRIKYVPIPMALQDDNSFAASKLAYAAGLQGKFLETHEAIIENYSEVDDQYIQNLALSLGLNEERLKIDMEDPEIEERLRDNGSMFIELGGYGTPSYLIGRNTFFVPSDGPASVSDFQRMFNDARNNS